MFLLEDGLKKGQPAVAVARVAKAAIQSLTNTGLTALVPHGHSTLQIKQPQIQQSSPTKPMPPSSLPALLSPPNVPNTQVKVAFIILVSMQEATATIKIMVGVMVANTTYMAIGPPSIKDSTIKN